MESKGQSGAAPTTSPSYPCSLQTVSCILCFSSTRREITRGVLYIVDFRSRRVRGVQDCIETMHEGQVGPTMRPGVGSHDASLMTPKWMRSTVVPLNIYKFVEPRGIVTICWTICDKCSQGRHGFTYHKDF
jgi:hypothetical protein